MATIEPTDVLVAVADRNATAALALGDALYWAADLCAKATAQYEDAIADPHATEVHIRLRRSAYQRTSAALAPLSDRYEQLLASVDDDTYQRVEATVWRDRRAEYDHARQVAERERS